MSLPLTKKQSEVYKYIRHCISEEEYSPSLREICDKFGFKSVSTPQYYVNELIRKKWISRDKYSQIRLGGGGWYV